MIDADGGYGAECNVGKAILITVKIRAFQESGFGVDIPYFEVNTYGCMEVTHYLFTNCPEKIFGCVHCD
jgi:hypothetical protein